MLEMLKNELGNKSAQEFCHLLARQSFPKKPVFQLLYKHTNIFLKLVLIFDPLVLKVNLQTVFLFDLAQYLLQYEHSRLTNQFLTIRFIYFQESKLPQILQRSLVLILISQQKMEYFFGTDSRLRKSFPQFCSHLHILLSWLVLIFKDHRIFQSDSKVLLKIVKSRGIDELGMLLVLVTLLLLRVRIFFLWLLVDNWRRRRSHSDVNLIPDWRQWRERFFLA